MSSTSICTVNEFGGSPQNLLLSYTSKRKKSLRFQNKLVLRIVSNLSVKLSSFWQHLMLKQEFSFALNSKDSSIKCDIKQNYAIRQCIVGNDLLRSYKNNITWRFTCAWRMLLVLMVMCLIPAVKADPICDIIAATNIESVFTQWSCTTNGTTSTDPCMSPVWDGVTCTGDNIVAIAMDNSSLTGEYVIYLYICILTCMSVAGTLPSTIGSLTALTSLQINVTELSGSIPPSIGSITSLSNLDFSYNNLNGMNN